MFYGLLTVLCKKFKLLKSIFQNFDVFVSKALHDPTFKIKMFIANYEVFPHKVSDVFPIVGALVTVFVFVAFRTTSLFCTRHFSV